VAALKYLWGLTDTLQFIVFTTYWHIQVPAIAEAVIKTLKFVALGEFIPYEGIKSWIGERLGQPPANSDEIEAIEATGGGSSNFLENLDSLLLFALAIFVVILFVALFSCFKYINYKVFRTYMLIRNAIFWNVFIRYSLQSYTKMCFATVISLELIKWGSAKLVISNLMAIGTAVALLVLPVIYAYVLHKKKPDLIKYTVRSRIGSLYSGKKEEETAGQVFVLIYLARRLWFTFLTFALASQPHILVHLFMMNTLHYMIYIGFGEPYTSLLQWRVEIVNEFLLLTQNYYFVLYAGLVSDRKALDSIGLAHVMHLGVLIIFNFTVITVINISSICRKLHLMKLESE